MHHGDSVESAADSDLEDGELQKMLTSNTQADGEGKFEVSLI